MGIVCLWGLGETAAGAVLLRIPVITGVGVVSPFGVGTAAFYEGLAQGHSAVRRLAWAGVAALPVGVAAEVPVELSQADALIGQAEALLGCGLSSRQSAWLHRAEGEGALVDRKLGFAVLAALQACQAAGYSTGLSQLEVCVGVGLELGILPELAQLVRAVPGLPPRLDFSTQPLTPPIRLRTPVDLVPRMLTGLLGLSAIPQINVSACAASALALADAASRVARGQAVAVLAGGTDSMVNPLGLGGMARLGAPSPRAASSACRPFDLQRDGLVIGEGAAFFVVEDLRAAEARGQPVLARLCGWGSSQDAYRVTAPRPDGATQALAIRQALQRAGVGPSQIDYINAHGTGTPLNDPAEAQALHAALGDAANHIPVSSIKGAVGHLMAAAGAIEAAACLFAIERQIVPGTAHFQTPDPSCPLAVVGPTPMATRVRTALSNSFGFGGQNACLIFSHPTWSLH